MNKTYICDYYANKRGEESVKESNMEDKIIPQIIVVVSIFAVFYLTLLIAYAIT